MSSNYNLSIGSVKKFSNLSQKSSSSVEDILQVLESKITPGKQNGNIYTVTLSDSINKFDRFFMPEKLGGSIKDGDLLMIKSIQKCSANGKMFFKVMKYEVVGYSSDPIGNPVILDTESASTNNNSGSTSEPVKKTTDNQFVKAKETKVNNNHTNLNFTSNQPTKNFHYKLSQLSTFTKDLSILVRCMKRSDKKTLKSSKGLDYTVFSFVVMDSEDCQMQISCYGKFAEKFYPIVQEGKMYEIVGGFVKVNDHKFNTTKADYQINLNDDSIVTPIEDNGDISDINPNLTSLSELNDLKVFTAIDFLALVVSAGEKTLIKTKKGDMHIKKLSIVDDSEYRVDFTLWNKNSDISLKYGDIIFVRNAKIGDYGGRNISASDDSQITINPTLKSLKEKIIKIKKLAGNNNVDSTFENINDNKNSFSSPNICDDPEKMEFNTLSEKKESHNNNTKLNESNNNNVFKNFKTYQSEQTKKEKALYEYRISNLKDALNDAQEKVHKVKVHVTQFNHSDKNYYAGCPKCKKKLLESSEGLTCPACKQVVNEPYYYFTVSFRVKDCTSDQFVDCYGPLAEKILEVKGEEYKNYMESSNSQALKLVCGNVEFKEFIMCVKVRTQNYNNVTKKKLSMINVDKVEIKNEADRMLKFMELGC